MLLGQVLTNFSKKATECASVLQLNLVIPNVIYYLGTYQAVRTAVSVADVPRFLGCSLCNNGLPAKPVHIIILFYNGKGKDRERESCSFHCNRPRADYKVHSTLSILEKRIHFCIQQFCNFTILNLKFEI